MMWLLYLVAFTCLLRPEEAARLKFENFELCKEKDDKWYLTVTIPWRKTHPFGGMCTEQAWM